MNVRHIVVVDVWEKQFVDFVAELFLASIRF